MYKVTGYFRDNKVTRSFTDLYDAIDFRDIVDAHYPLNVTFEKVIDMREFIYDSWNGIMDAERNPLKHIPDTNVRHMVMQVLAWMWCITFAMLIGSWTVFAISAIAHVFLISAIVITVATFETAKRKPQFFGGFGRGIGGEHE
jgi:uncharacterized membrane protein YjjP (DUF1212 family)